MRDVWIKELRIIYMGSPEHAGIGLEAPSVDSFAAFMLRVNGEGFGYAQRGL